MAKSRGASKLTNGRGRATTGEAAYALRLFVAGATAQSTRAILHARRLCDEHLRGRFTLEVVDIYQQPLMARDDPVIAVPTLLRMRPPPVRRLVGDLSDTERVLGGLDLPVGPAPDDRGGWGQGPRAASDCSAKPARLTARSSSTSTASSSAMRPSGHAFGPSDSARAGSG